MIVGKLARTMIECLPLSYKFINFYASYLYCIEDEDYEITESSGNVIEVFILQGNDTWLMTLGRKFNNFCGLS